MILRIAGVLLLLLLVAGVSHLAAVERLKLNVSPSVAFAPANVVVRASIEPDAQNRAVEVEAESPAFYRSSEIELDGDRAPRTNTFEFRSLPPGVYEVSATLMGPGETVRATAHHEVDVMGDGEDDSPD